MWHISMNVAMNGYDTHAAILWLDVHAHGPQHAPLPICVVWLLLQCTPHTHTHTHTSHMWPHSVHTHTHTHTGDGSLGWQCDPRDVQAESHRRQLLKGCSGGAPLVSEPVRLPNNSRADVTSTCSLYVGRLPKPLWTLLVPGISTRWVMAIHSVTIVTIPAEMKYLF